MMLDLNKPMASKKYGKVVNWHLVPDWVGYEFSLICQFESQETLKFTKDGIYQINKVANPKTDLYNIEEKPYWSKPEDVPMCALWVRSKLNPSIRSLVYIVNDCFIETEVVEIYWRDIRDYEYYNGTEWKECRCE